MKKSFYESGQMAWYMRLSVADDDGKDESNSISSQRKCMEDYCEKHMPGETAIEYVDDGYSGTNFDRPHFRKMFFMIRNGTVKTVVVKDLSRLGRNYIEVGNLLERVFPYYGVRFVSVNDHFDTKNITNGTVGLEIAIRNLMNEYYSKDISKKIISATRVKKLSGEYVFGAVPFGYKKGKEKNSIVLDEEAAGIVKYVFSMALSGMGYSAIAKRLNEEGVITPSAYLAEHGGRGNYKVSVFWSYESVRNLLSNRIYTGDMEISKSHVRQVGSNKVKTIPEKERDIVENTHEAIVDRAEFEQARNVVKVTKPKTPSKGKTGILNGYLECGCCGGRLFKGKAENHYFLCVNARYRPESGCCKVRAEEKQMQEIIRNAIMFQIDLLEDRDARQKLEKAKKGSRILELQKQLAGLRLQERKGMEQKTKLYEDFVEGKLTKEAYLREKDAFTKKVEQIKANAVGLSEQIDEIAKAQGKEENREPEAGLFGNFKNKEISEAMLSALVKKVVVMPDGNVEIYWKHRDEYGEYGKNVNAM